MKSSILLWMISRFVSAISLQVFIIIYIVFMYLKFDTSPTVSLCFAFTQYVLNPTFQKSEIAQLDKTTKLSRAFDGTTYRPGTVY